jgi:hypothetical protein
MSEDAETMFEMMIHAERFCSAVENLADDLAGKEHEELRMKISQCRSLLQQLRLIYDASELTATNGSACGYFRQLIIAFMWTAHYARKTIDFRLFRKLVVLESSFTYLLIKRGFRNEW